jgi:hypothetical protein
VRQDVQAVDLQKTVALYKRKGEAMKIAPLVFALLLAMAGFANAQVTNWSNSPYNFQNSPHNFNNSPYNFQNSPHNFNNSPYNFNSGNGVYDNQGNRVGYGVTSPTGVTNYFDNNGNRMGYSPGR